MKYRGLRFSLLVVFGIAACTNQFQSVPKDRCASVACPQVVQQGPGLPFVEFSIPTAPSDPRGIALGSDMRVWFVENSSNKIGRLTTTGIFTEYVIPTVASGLINISPGRSGKLWFTENKTSKIGQITTAGVITEYPTLTPKAGPYAITLGPDKRMWFTEAKANKIGVVTGSGSIKEYTVPTPASGLAGITSGPDGALWFTESNTNKIGRITTSGVITEYPVTGTARYITSAKDGNLWFTNPANGNLGRISTTGSVSYFLTTPTASPWGITRGPDGNPWVAELAANAVQYYDTAAAQMSQPFFLPTAKSSPTQITNGPDGNLWFTEKTGKIGVYVRLLQTVTPSSIAFTAVGETQAFSVTELHYSGSFTVSGCSPGIATVTPTSGKNFTATAQGVGTCQLAISDTKRNTSFLAISVTTTNFQDQ